MAINAFMRGTPNDLGFMPVGYAMCEAIRLLMASEVSYCSSRLFMRSC